MPSKGKFRRIRPRNTRPPAILTEAGKSLGCKRLPGRCTCDDCLVQWQSSRFLSQGPSFVDPVTVILDLKLYMIRELLDNLRFSRDAFGDQMLAQYTIYSPSECATIIRDAFKGIAEHKTSHPGQGYDGKSLSDPELLQCGTILWDLSVDGMLEGDRLNPLRMLDARLSYGRDSFTLYDSQQLEPAWFIGDLAAPGDERVVIVEGRSYGILCSSDAAVCHDQLIMALPKAFLLLDRQLKLLTCLDKLVEALIREDDSSVGPGRTEWDRRVGTRDSQHVLPRFCRPLILDGEDQHDETTSPSQDASDQLERVPLIRDQARKYLPCKTTFGEHGTGGQVRYQQVEEEESSMGEPTPKQRETTYRSSASQGLAVDQLVSFMSHTSIDEGPRRYIPSTAPRKIKTRGSQGAEAETPDEEEVGPKNGMLRIEVDADNLRIFHRIYRVGILASGEIRWPHFVAAMVDAGFIVSKGSGSAFSFTKQDTGVSISLHKPHPEPTITRHVLRSFRTRLTKTYGFSGETFVERTKPRMSRELV